MTTTIAAAQAALSALEGAKNPAEVRDKLGPALDAIKRSNEEDIGLLFIRLSDLFSPKEEKKMKYLTPFLDRIGEVVDLHYPQSLPSITFKVFQIVGKKILDDERVASLFVKASKEVVSKLSNHICEFTDGGPMEERKRTELENLRNLGVILRNTSISLSYRPIERDFTIITNTAAMLEKLTELYGAYAYARSGINPVLTLANEGRSVCSIVVGWLGILLSACSDPSTMISLLGTVSRCIDMVPQLVKKLAKYVIIIHDRLSRTYNPSLSKVAVAYELGRMKRSVPIQIPMLDPLNEQSAGHEFGEVRSALESTIRDLLKLADVGSLVAKILEEVYDRSRRGDKPPFTLQTEMMRSSAADNKLDKYDIQYLIKTLVKHSLKTIDEMVAPCNDVDRMLVMQTLIEIFINSRLDADLGSEVKSEMFNLMVDRALDLHDPTLLASLLTTVYSMQSCRSVAGRPSLLQVIFPIDSKGLYSGLLSIIERTFLTCGGYMEGPGLLAMIYEVIPFIPPESEEMIREMEKVDVRKSDVAVVRGGIERRSQW